MKWKQVSRYALVSGCGAFSVAKIFVNGGRRYELWQRSPRRLLSTHPTADEAKSAVPQLKAAA